MWSRRPKRWSGRLTSSTRWLARIWSRRPTARASCCRAAMARLTSSRRFAPTARYGRNPVVQWRRQQMSSNPAKLDQKFLQARYRELGMPKLDAWGQQAQDHWRENLPELAKYLQSNGLW